MSTKPLRSCSETVYPSGSWGGHSCLINASVFEDGKWWCTRHSPSGKRARREERQARWEAERERSDALHRRAEKHAAALSKRLGVKVRAEQVWFGRKRTDRCQCVLDGEEVT